MSAACRFSYVRNACPCNADRHALARRIRTAGGIRAGDRVLKQILAESRHHPAWHETESGGYLSCGLARICNCRLLYDVCGCRCIRTVPAVPYRSDTQHADSLRHSDLRAVAIAAIAPQIRSNENAAAISAAAVSLLGTVFTVVYSLAYHGLGFSPAAYGAFCGATLHEVAHAAAASGAGGKAPSRWR